MDGRRRSGSVGRGRSVALLTALLLISGVGWAGAQEEGDATAAGVAPTGGIAYTFVGHIEQDGALIVNVGYLTAVDGLDPSELFTSDDPLERSAETARITYFTSGTLTERSVVENLFATSGTGETTFRYDADGGATFEDPTSFQEGEEIATTASTWDNLVNVQSPDMGIVTAQSDEEQLTASTFDLDGRSVVLGAEGQRYRLTFTGHGVRTDAEAPRASVNYAGQAVAVGDAADEAGGAASGQSEAADDDSPLPLILAIVAVVLSLLAVLLAARRPRRA